MQWVVIIFMFFAGIGMLLFDKVEDIQDRRSNKPSPAESPIQGLSTQWGVSEDAGGVVGNLSSRNFYVVLDGSGSMAETECGNGRTKMRVAQESLAKFVNVVPEDAQLGLLVFDDSGAYERVPLGLNNREDFLNKVKSVLPGGATPLHNALFQAVKNLEIQAARQLGYGDYNLVVVTDGAASNGQDPRRVIGHLLKYSPITLHTIGFCIDENHSLNQPGKTIYKTAQNQVELAQGLEGVLAEAEEFDDVTDFKN